MPIEPKRIEAAAREYWSWIDPEKLFDDLAPEHRSQMMAEMRRLLAAAFPDLASDPPTAWVAPWEVTEAMWIAGSEAPHAKRFVQLVEEADAVLLGQAVSASAHGGAMASQAYRAMRDAHTKEQT